MTDSISREPPAAQFSDRTANEAAVAQEVARLLGRELDLPRVPHPRANTKEQRAVEPSAVSSVAPSAIPAQLPRTFGSVYETITKEPFYDFSGGSSHLASVPSNYPTGWTGLGDHPSEHLKVPSSFVGLDVSSPAAARGQPAQSVWSPWSMSKNPPLVRESEEYKELARSFDKEVSGSGVILSEVQATSKVLEGQYVTLEETARRMRTGEVNALLLENMLMRQLVDAQNDLKHAHRNIALLSKDRGSTKDLLCLLQLNKRQLVKALRTMQEEMKQYPRRPRVDKRCRWRTWAPPTRS